MMIEYWRNITFQKLMLWCYLIWWSMTVFHHFDASLKLWVNSLGISLVIGTALMFSVKSSFQDKWQIFRLYWMPFAVSSFAALIKNQGYFVIFSPSFIENMQAASACIMLCSVVMLLKLGNTRTLQNS